MKINLAKDRLHDVTVGHVMKRDVLAVNDEDSMCSVAALFLQHQLSAAPVVDDRGQLLGMLSATDFLRRATDCDHRQVSLAPDGSGWEVVSGPDIAGSWVSTSVQSVSPQTPLITVTEIFETTHLHRLPVVEEGNRLVGVISTTDVIAALRDAILQAETPTAP